VYILTSWPINIDIKNELSNRGFDQIFSTDNRNAVLTFESYKTSETLLDEIYNKPFLRVILQLISSKSIHEPNTFPMNKEDIRTLFSKYKEKLKLDVIGCPDKKLICHHCRHRTVIIPYNIYFNQKPHNSIRCPVCHMDNDPSLCEEEDDWSFFEEKYFSKFITPFIAILEDNKIISTYLLGTCFRCHRSNKEPIKEFPKVKLNPYSNPTLMAYIKNFHCKECGHFYDFEKMIDFEPKQKEFWIKKGGAWFEWYVKNLIKISNPSSPIEQGIQIKNGETLEIDVILLKNNRLITIQCKATNPDKLKFEQVADVIKLLPFSDEIYLITTALISENDKKSLLKHCGDKLKIISGKDIESCVIEI
jgi:hypothetical protein